MRRLLLLVMLLCMASRAAMAVCVTLNLANVGTQQTFVGASGGYDVFDTAVRGQVINFQVKSLATVAACAYFIVLRSGQSGDGNNRYLNLNGTRLPYNVYTDTTYSNVMLPAGSATLSNVVVGSFPVLVGVTQTQNKSFAWKIPPQQIVPASASNYADNGVVLELWEGVLGVVPVLRDTVTINFQAKVDTKVDLSIVNTGSTFDEASTNKTVGFGNVASGANRSFDFNMRSNSGYSVTMQSSNKQVLKQGGVSATIPYSVTVGGVARNLSSGSAVPVATQAGGTTALTGTNIPVKVTLGTITGGETAGNYQDNLSITVSAN